MGEELYCVESSVSSCFDSPRSDIDFSVLDHDKTIANLLELQEKHLIRDNKCKLEPACRKLVATWMLEVCEEQSCEDQVFLVAVSIMDRFLNMVSVRKTQLQLLAAVCLLLSSKLRQSHFLSVDLLAYYTDNSITRDEITQWEMLVVARLGWDVSPVTAVDFVDSLLRRLSVTGDNIIRRHAVTFVALAATESEFIGTKPSLIATASIVSAVRGIYPHLGRPAVEILSQTLQTHPNEVKHVLDRLERTVDRTSKESSSSCNVPFTPNTSTDDLLSSHRSSLSNSYGNNSISHSNNDSLPPNKQMSRQMQIDPDYICYSPAEQDSQDTSSEDSGVASDYEGYETPTDITDVQFTE